MFYVWISNIVKVAFGYLKVSMETVIIIKWLFVLISSIVIVELVNIKLLRKFRCLCE